MCQDTLKADLTATGDIVDIFGLAAVAIRNGLHHPAAAAGDWTFLHMAWPGLGPLVIRLPSEVLGHRGTHLAS